MPQGETAFRSESGASTIDFMNPLQKHMTTEQKMVILLERSEVALLEIRDILIAGLDADGLRALKGSIPKGPQQKPKPQGRR